MSKEMRRSGNISMEMVIGNLLRIGVVTAAAIVFLGGVIYLAHHGSSAADYRIFQREPTYLCNVAGIIANAFSSQGSGMIQLGVLFLIATPIMRVVFSIFMFARERDTLYVIITLIVFSVLMYSLLGR